MQSLKWSKGFPVILLVGCGLVRDGFVTQRYMMLNDGYNRMDFHVFPRVELLDGGNNRQEPPCRAGVRQGFPTTRVCTPVLVGTVIR